MVESSVVVVLSVVVDTVAVVVVDSVAVDTSSCNLQVVISLRLLYFRLLLYFQL